MLLKRGGGGGGGGGGGQGGSGQSTPAAEELVSRAGYGAPTYTTLRWHAHDQAEYRPGKS